MVRWHTLKTMHLYCIYAIKEAFIPWLCPDAYGGILGSPPFLCAIIVSKDTKTIQN